MGSLVLVVVLVIVIETFFSRTSLRADASVVAKAMTGQVGAAGAEENEDEPKGEAAAKKDCPLCSIGGIYR